MSTYTTTAENVPTVKPATIANTPTVKPATISGTLPKVQSTSIAGQTPTVTAEQTAGQTPTVNWQSMMSNLPNVSAEQFGDLSSLGGMIPRSIDNIGGPGGGIQDYMNPYLNAVMGDGLSELQRQYELTRQARAGGAHMAGAFGDARHGVAEAEAERHLQDTSQRFINQVLSQGYDNAMGLRQNDINRIMQAGQFDIGNEMAVRQFDVANAFNAALQNAGFQMQALSQDQQAALQAGMANANNLIGQMQGDADRALQAGLASAGFRMEALSADQQARLRASIENVTNAMQRRLANQQALQDARFFNVGNMMETRQQNQDARQDTRFFNASNEMTAQQADANRMLQSYLAQPGMDGQRIDNELSIINAMLGIGDREQQQQQQSANLAYMDFLRQQGYPQEQLEIFSQILSAIPMGQTTTASQQQGSNPLGAIISMMSLIPTLMKI